MAILAAPHTAPRARSTETMQLTAVVMRSMLVVGLGAFMVAAMVSVRQGHPFPGTHALVQNGSVLSWVCTVFMGLYGLYSIRYSLSDMLDVVNDVASLEGGPSGSRRNGIVTTMWAAWLGAFAVAASLAPAGAFVAAVVLVSVIVSAYVFRRRGLEAVA